MCELDVKNVAKFSNTTFVVLAQKVTGAERKGNKRSLGGSCHRQPRVRFARTAPGSGAPTPRGTPGPPGSPPSCPHLVPALSSIPPPPPSPTNPTSSPSDTPLCLPPDCCFSLWDAAEPGRPPRGPPPLYDVTSAIYGLGETASFKSLD